MSEASPWTKLVTEFNTYVADVYTQPEEVRAGKMFAVMSRFADAAVRQAASKMYDLDLDCSKWSDADLADRMLQHVSYRSSKINMLPGHCMMLEASRRLVPAKWHKYPDEEPTVPGVYVVMVSGDSETDGPHVYYSFDDYQTFATLTNKDIEGFQSFKGFHDEESHTFFAWYGPIEIPKCESP
jgi:hypothetical protein